MLCKHFIQTAGGWRGTRTESDFVVDHNYNEVQEITEVFASFGLRAKCLASAMHTLRVDVEGCKAMAQLELACSMTN